MDYGIQLFSVRDTTPHDMEGTLRKLSEIGYRKVEFAGFFGHSAEQIRQWMDLYGLTCSGTHTSLDEITADLDQTIAYHRQIGNFNIIIPGADLSTEEKLDAFIQNVNSVIPVLKAEGITLGYHNHSHEFQPTSYQKVIYTELERRTDLEFEVDTYWAYHAGVDPVALMERLAHRIRVIHLKDGLVDGSGKPLGLGDAPVKAVWKKAEELGFLQVVESETLHPDGMTEAAVCFDCLKGWEKGT